LAKVSPRFPVSVFAAPQSMSDMAGEVAACNTVIRISDSDSDEGETRDAQILSEANCSVSAADNVGEGHANCRSAIGASGLAARQGTHEADSANGETAQSATTNLKDNDLSLAMQKRSLASLAIEIASASGVGVKAIGNDLRSSPMKRPSGRQAPNTPSPRKGKTPRAAVTTPEKETAKAATKSNAIEGAKTTAAAETVVKARISPTAKAGLKAASKATAKKAANKAARAVAKVRGKGTPKAKTIADASSCKAFSSRAALGDAMVEEANAGRKDGRHQKQQKRNNGVASVVLVPASTAVTTVESIKGARPCRPLGRPRKNSVVRPSTASGREPRRPRPAFCTSPRAELRCYEVLGIMRSATATDIRHAYRRKALQLHPDKGGGTRAFLSVAEAFEALSENGSRQAYDQELLLFDSSDGLGGTFGDGVAAAPTVTINELVGIVHALCEMPPEEWPSHVADLTRSSLEQMHSLIVNPKRLLSGQGFAKTNVGAGDGDQFISRRTFLLWHAKDEKWFVRIGMGGLSICSRGTRCSATAAQWHISVVTLKELFTAHRRAHPDSPMEEVWIAAFRQARSQKIYFPGEQFSFSFGMKVKVDGVLWQPWTPSVHNLELALEHHKRFLAVRDMGRRTIILLKSELKKTASAMKVAWQTHMNAMQKQLLGYVSCELHHRGRAKTLTSSPEHMLALPWLTGLLADQTKSNEEMQEVLGAYLNSDGAASLKQFLQGAVRSHLLEPQLALEEVKPGMPVGATVRKRKFKSIGSAP